MHAGANGPYWNGPQPHHVMNGPRPYPTPWGAPYTSLPPLPFPPRFHAPPPPLPPRPFFGSHDYHMHSGQPRPPTWHSHNRGANRGRQKSKKVEVDELSKNFVCRKCTKGYSTRENFDLHIKSHVKCASCDYEASPRAIKDHQLIHFVPEELKFSSPADIAKWREDRKKNYPSAENIAKKKQLASERKDRGEVAVTPLHKYIKHLIGDDQPIRGRGFHRGGRGRGFHQRGRGNSRRGRGRGFHSNMERNTHSIKTYEPKPEIQDESRDQQELSILQPNTTEQFKNSELSDCPLSELKPTETGTTMTQVRTAPVQPHSNNGGVTHRAEGEGEGEELEAGIIRAILSDASSSSSPSVLCGDKTLEVSGEAETETNERKGELGTTSAEAESSSNSKDSETNLSESPSDVAAEIQSPPLPLQQQQQQQQGSKPSSMKRKSDWASRREVKRRCRRAQPCGLAAVPRRPKKPTLLEKLLASEMRREHNTILQCIRYTIAHDFFDPAGQQ